MHQGPVVAAHQIADHQWQLLGQPRHTVARRRFLGMRWQELPVSMAVLWVERHTQLQLLVEVPREGHHPCCQQVVGPSLLDPSVAEQYHQSRMVWAEVLLLLAFPLVRQRGWSGHWLLHS